MNPPPMFPPGPGTGFGFDNRPSLGSIWVDGTGRPRGRVGVPGSFGHFDAVNEAAKARGMGEKRIGFGAPGMMDFGAVPDGNSQTGAGGGGWGGMQRQQSGPSSAGAYARERQRSGFGQNMNLWNADKADAAAQKHGFAQNGQDPFRAMKFAEGGEIIGPGGPKDDMVPIMASNGERIIPEETNSFFGDKFFLDLDKKAAKGRQEIAQMQGPDKRAPMGIPHMKDGGNVSFQNPFADDPAAYAARQRQANDARMAPMGITDTGMGSRVLSNPYGTGFSIQAPPGAPGVFNDMQGGQMTVTPGKGGQAVPDVVPSGPWAAPAMMDDVRARQADIATKSASLLANAPFNRGIDSMVDTMKARFTDKGRANITVPVRTGLPQGPAVGNPFWEREAAAKANLAPDPGALTRPDGVQQKDWRRYIRSPQGMRDAQGAAEDAKRAAGAKDFTPIPGSPDYLINGLGNIVPKGSTKPVAMTMEEATKMGLEIASVDEQGRARWKPKAAPGADKGTITRIPGPMIEDPVTKRQVPGPDIPVMVDPRTGRYRKLTPEEETAAAAPAAPAASGGPTAITSQAEYDKLPPGAAYTFNGKTGTKKAAK